MPNTVMSVAIVRETVDGLTAVVVTGATYSKTNAVDVLNEWPFVLTYTLTFSKVNTLGDGHMIIVLFTTDAGTAAAAPNLHST